MATFKTKKEREDNIRVCLRVDGFGSGLWPVFTGTGIGGGETLGSTTKMLLNFTEYLPC